MYNLLLNIFCFLPSMVQVVIFFHVLKKGNFQLAYDMADYAKGDIEYLLFAAYSRENTKMIDNKTSQFIKDSISEIDQYNKDIIESLKVIDSQSASDTDKTKAGRNIKHTYKVAYSVMCEIETICKSHKMYPPMIPFPLNQYIDYEI